MTATATPRPPMTLLPRTSVPRFPRPRLQLFLFSYLSLCRFVCVCLEPPLSLFGPAPPPPFLEFWLGPILLSTSARARALHRAGPLSACRSRPSSPCRRWEAMRYASVGFVVVVAEHFGFYSTRHIPQTRGPRPPAAPTRSRPERRPLPRPGASSSRDKRRGAPTTLAIPRQDAPTGNVLAPKKRKNSRRRLTTPPHHQNHQRRRPLAAPRSPRPSRRPSARTSRRPGARASAPPPRRGDPARSPSWRPSRRRAPSSALRREACRRPPGSSSSS